MPRVLCIDTEPTTIAAIESDGHEVQVGQAGYRTGQSRQSHPPHEFDAIVCDLKKPGCFDRNWWGPGKNHNMSVRLVTDLTLKDNHGKGVSKNPRFVLIRSDYLKPPMHHFAPEDVLNAVN